MIQQFLRFFDFNAMSFILLGKKFLSAIVVLLVCRIIAGFLRHMMNRAKKRGLDPAVAPLLNSIVSYLVYIVGVLVILDIFGINTASIVALLGAAGLAIGFALKDTLSNIAAGIILLFLHPFKANDYIECGEIKGHVQKIGLFSTVLVAPDGVYISAPNGSLWGSSISNYTRNGNRRMDIVVGIAYEDSIEKALGVLIKVANEEPRVFQSPTPQVFTEELAESAVNVHLWAWTSVEGYHRTRWDLIKKVKEAMDAAGICIPFPQRVVTLVTPDQENDKLS